ncbi:MAG TPA: hypothetical protein ENK23_03920 [Sorangium sp.]|nr:hypothetical protein [Sorangium sp.]
MMSQNTTIQRGLGALTVLLVASSIAACGGNDKQVDQPVVTATAPVPPPVPVPPPAPTVQTGPCDATMQVALQTAIEARKSDLSPGMKPEGGFGCESVAEGGSLKLAVSLQPGRCYTFLANSFPNVSELDMVLKANLGANPSPLVAGFAGQPLAQDNETGPAASIGSGKNCFKNPLPIAGAGMLEITSRTGAGPVAVQVFSK